MGFDVKTDMFKTSEQLSRINVVGSNASGKSTFARKLAERLNSRYVEMDAVFWEPNWKKPSDKDFLERLAGAVAGDRWVLDGNYDRTSDVKWARVQTVIWLDYPLHLKLFRLSKRTIIRWFKGDELWPGTGNRESLRLIFSRESIFLFAYRTHATHRRRYEAFSTEPPRPDLRFVRLRSPHEAEQFLATVTG